MTSISVAVVVSSEKPVSWAQMPPDHGNFVVLTIHLLIKFLNFQLYMFSTI